MKWRRGLGGWLGFLLLCGLTVGAYSQRFAVMDWLVLRNYQPLAEVSQLADQDTMTAKARHLFYINRPGIEDKSTFRRHCAQFGEQTIILGCYIGVERGIHVLQVSDDRLQGVEQVTAAHEMLHAAYDRLSAGERARVNGLLQQYADSGLDDDRIKTVLQTYQKTEPSQQLNEMHSIFGTEIADLPPELETYYSHYFTDRQTVAGFAAAYQAAFTSRQASINQYDQQLKTLAAQIKVNTANLENQESGIEAGQRQLEAWKRAGDIQRYNDGVSPFNAKVEVYNDLLGQTKQQITQYNQLVAERNAVAAETAELQQAIDSSNLPGAK